MISLNTLKSAVGLALLLALAGCAESFGPLDSPYDAKNPTRAILRVTYNGNEQLSGLAPVDATAYGPGDKVTLLGNLGNLAKSPAVFDGWNTRADGKGTSLAPGNTLVLGTSNVTLFARWNLGSQQVPITGLTLSESTTTVAIGSSKVLTPSFVPSNTTQTDLLWLSSDEAIATVTSLGQVTAVSEGTATIMATSVALNKSARCTVKVVAAAVDADSVTLDKNSVSLVAGGAPVDLVPTFTPGNTTNTALTWKSSDTNVATVSDRGKVTPLTAGAAVIEVTTTNGKVARCTVYVGSFSVPVAGIALSSTSMNLVAQGATGSLAATISPEGATNKNLSWSSSDETVATVSTSGVITPLKLGTTVIIATTADGGKIATCTVTVGAASLPVSGINLDVTSMNLVAGGSTGTLNASITPPNATNKNVSWSSSDTKVASVSSSGTVSPLTIGTAVITATTSDGGKTASCTVTVGAAMVPVTGINLNTTTLNLVAGGTSGALTATILPTGATNSNVSWSSLNPAIATVSSSGLVSPLAGGTTTITATTADGNKTATCTVTVAFTGTAGFTFQLGAYGTLAFPTGGTTVAQGASVTLTPAASPVASGGTGWQWLIDGVPAGSTSSLVFDATAKAPGTYQVGVMVNYGTVLYSGTTQVTVAKVLQSFAYVACYGTNKVVPFRITNTGANPGLTAGTAAATGSHPEMVVTTPDGRYLYSGNTGDSTVSAFSIGATGNLTAVGTYPVTGGAQLLAMNPRYSANSATHNSLYVGDATNNKVSAFTINPATGALTQVSGSPFTLGDASIAFTGLYALGVDPSGNFLHATSNADASGGVWIYPLAPANGAVLPGSRALQNQWCRTLAYHPVTGALYYHNQSYLAEASITNAGATATQNQNPYYWHSLAVGGNTAVDAQGRFLFSQCLAQNSGYGVLHSLWRIKLNTDGTLVFSGSGNPLDYTNAYQIRVDSTADVDYVASDPTGNFLITSASTYSTAGVRFWPVNADGTLGTSTSYSSVVSNSDDPRGIAVTRF